MTTGLDAEVAAAAAGVSVTSAGDATAAAVRAGVLTAAAEGGGLTFVHDLVRESLSSRLSPERARAAHRRLAGLLAGRTGHTRRPSGRALGRCRRRPGGLCPGRDLVAAGGRGVGAVAGVRGRRRPPGESGPGGRRSGSDRHAARRDLPRRRPSVVPRRSIRGRRRRGRSSRRPRRGRRSPGPRRRRRPGGGLGQLSGCPGGDHPVGPGRAGPGRRLDQRRDPSAAAGPAGRHARELRRGPRRPTDRRGHGSRAPQRGPGRPPRGDRRPDGVHPRDRVRRRAAGPGRGGRRDLFAAPGTGAGAAGPHVAPPGGGRARGHGPGHGGASPPEAHRRRDPPAARRVARPPRVGRHGDPARRLRRDPRAARARERGRPGVGRHRRRQRRERGGLRGGPAPRGPHPRPGDDPADARPRRRCRR